jgi:hypothetical protein
MVRYLKQPEKYSCGPIAVMNVFKWAGFVFSHREAKDWFYAEVGYWPGSRWQEGGTSPCSIDQGLRSVNRRIGNPLRVLRRYHVTKAELDQRLADGEAAILLTGRKPDLYSVTPEFQGREPGEFWGHYVFCLGRRGSQYILVNDARTCDWEHKTIYYAPNQRMRKMLRRYGSARALRRYGKRTCYPTAWFLKKIQEVG